MRTPPERGDTSNSQLLPQLLHLVATFILAIATLLLSTACAKCEEYVDSSRVPNIVLILTDDLGYGDLACYGHRHIRTPHLDALAADGIRLTDCYSPAPVCSPARAGLLTGRTPTRTGVYDWIPDQNPMELPRHEITLATLLREAGYQTAVFGKWHLVGRFNDEGHPQPHDHGFDYWFATQNNAAPSHENPRNFVRNGAPAGEIEGYACQIVAGEALEWMAGPAGSGEPFFALVSFHEPHEPVASPPHLVESYREVARNEDEAQYFANVTNLDDAVGRLLAALDEWGIAEDTLVFFTSDNGPETLNRYRGANRSYGSPGPLREMKLWLYDGGIRVPGILRWPGRIAPGQISSEPISGVDLLPTLCELAGVDVPADRAIDGTSFVPLFDGEPLERQVPLYWHYYRSLGEPIVAMRDGNWMVLGHADGGDLGPAFFSPEDVERIKSTPLGRFELYRIDADIRQARDLAEAYPQKLEQLAGQLTRLYEEIQREAPGVRR